jgi:glycosyltransferase involved in cell wall biosynthesis
MQKYKLAVLSSHPIQYQTPLFCKLASHPNIDLTVYFCWDFGVEKEQFEPGFGVSFKWDIPLLEGYRYKFLKKYFPYASENRSQLLFNPGIIKALWRKRYDAILVHGYTTVPSWLAFLGARLSGTPILFYANVDLYYPRSSVKRILKNCILIPLFKSINAFLYECTSGAEYFRQYKVSDDKLFFCPCAVDNTFWQEQAVELRDKKSALRNKLGIPDGYSVILCAAKLIPRKRPMDLLRAYGEIQDKVNAALFFVGDGVERHALEACTKEHNIKNVHFVGFKNQTELPDYFVIADVFVLPSNQDPSPRVINEAMNFSIPIITTNMVGTAPDLVKDGENGFIYPAGDIEKLADCLFRLMQDPEIREKMGKRSLEIISRWGYKEDVEGILDALEYIRER